MIANDFLDVSPDISLSKCIFLYVFIYVHVQLLFIWNVTVPLVLSVSLPPSTYSPPAILWSIYSGKRSSSLSSSSVFSRDLAAGLAEVQGHFDPRGNLKRVRVKSGVYKSVREADRRRWSTAKCDASRLTDFDETEFAPTILHDFT